VASPSGTLSTTTAATARRTSRPALFGWGAGAAAGGATGSGAAGAGCRCRAGAP